MTSMIYGHDLPLIQARMNQPAALSQESTNRPRAGTSEPTIQPKRSDPNRVANEIPPAVPVEPPLTTGLKELTLNQPNSHHATLPAKPHPSLVSAVATSSAAVPSSHAQVTMSRRPSLANIMEPIGLVGGSQPQPPSSASSSIYSSLPPTPIPFDHESIKEQLLHELEAAREENRVFYINSAKKMIEMQDKIDELTRQNVKLIKGLTPHQQLNW